MGYHIPIVVSEGTAFERGYHLGRSEAGRVRHAVSAYMAMFRLAGLRRQDVSAQAARFLPIIADYAPHLVEEMRGIADGSGRELWEIVALNSRTELVYGVGARTECTSVGTAPRASADGHVRLAQNWDWHPAMAGALVLWTIRRADGPDVLTLTEAGMVGKIGVNAEGMAMVVNLLTSDTDHPGPALPMHVILRRVLESAATVEDAIELIGAAPRCASCNHLLADRTGDLADVEATPAAKAVLRSGSGVLTHANHCLAPDLMACDSYARDKPDTVARGLRAEALAGDGPLDDAALRRVLSDHATAPGGICRHAQPELPLQEQATTIASVIMDLTAGTMDIADGPPCSNNYHTLRLRDFLRLPTAAR